MTKKLTLITAIAALTILPLGAYAAQNLSEINPTQESQEKRLLARQNRQGKTGDGSRKIDKLLEKLDLTPEQSSQLETIKAESKQTAEPLKEQMRSLRENIKSLLASDANEVEIRAQHQEIKGLHQQLSENRFETILKIREVLSSEQRAQMAELMEEHRGRKQRN